MFDTFIQDLWGYWSIDLLDRPRVPAAVLPESVAVLPPRETRGCCMGEKSRSALAGRRLFIRCDGTRCFSLCPGCVLPAQAE